jgi:adenylate cyclase class 2
MTSALEREIKLRFDTPEAARAAVLGIGAVPLRARRLQEDSLLDTAEGFLAHKRSALRVRMETGRTFLTFKGPVQPSTMKLREEIETTVGDGPVVLRVLEELGFRIWFRYQKYREEFALEEVTVALDETPVGTFVELEGTDRGIAAAAAALGRGPDDFVLESYRGLFIQQCEALGVPVTDMLFRD